MSEENNLTKVIKGFGDFAINLDKIESRISSVNYDPLNSPHMRDVLAGMSEKQMKEEEYKKSILETLRGIEKNTASLAEISALIRENTEKQEEVFKIITEILAMNLLKEKEQAESTYRSLMKRISTIDTDVKTIQRLSSLANNIYNQISLFL